MNRKKKLHTNSHRAECGGEEEERGRRERKRGGVRESAEVQAVYMERKGKEGANSTGKGRTLLNAIFLFLFFFLSHLFLHLNFIFKKKQFGKIK